MSAKNNLEVERLLGNWVRAHLPHGWAEFVMFGLKMAWACLFGAVLLGAIIISSLMWQDHWALKRYDALFLFALSIQISLLLFRLETRAEAKTILLFHIVGTVMELFKTAQGSWSYPEAAFFRIDNVPLFSGFMYAAVGSFIARAIRVFNMRFAPFVRLWAMLILALAIYGNFFWHHYWIDLRIGLFVATALMFVRTRVWFDIGQNSYWMPLPVSAFLTAFFMYIAENIGTFTGTWIYAGQAEFELVRLGKLGSWYLLLFISFFMVILTHPDTTNRQPLHKRP